MRSFTLASATRHISWTYRVYPQSLLRWRLLHLISREKPPITRVGRPLLSTINRLRVLLIVASGTLGIGITLAFWDDVKHAYAAVRRSGRVAATLALCINE